MVKHCIQLLSICLLLLQSLHAETEAPLPQVEEQYLKHLVESAVISPYDFIEAPSSFPDDRFLLMVHGDLFGLDTHLEGDMPERHLTYLLNLLERQQGILNELSLDTVGLWLNRQEVNAVSTHLHQAYELSQSLKHSFGTFSKDFSETLDELEIGNHFFFPFEWPKHVVILQITRESEESYELKVINLGEGLNHHAKFSSSGTPLYVPYFLLSGLDKAKLTGDTFLQGLHELGTLEAHKKKPPLNEGDFYNALLSPLGSKAVSHTVQVEELMQEQRSGTCSYASLHAYLNLQSKNSPAIHRLRFEQRLKTLVDYFDIHRASLAHSEKRRILARKSLTYFSTEIASFYDQKILSTAELAYVAKVCSDLDQILLEAEETAEKELQAQRAQAETETSFNSFRLFTFKSDIPYVSTEKKERLQRYHSHDYRLWSPDPTTIADDIEKLIAHMIQSSKGGTPDVAVAMFREATLRLPFQDLSFWSQLPESRVLDVLHQIAVVSKVFTAALTQEVVQGLTPAYSLRPSDYLAQTVWLTIAEELQRQFNEVLEVKSISLVSTRLIEFLGGESPFIQLEDAKWDELFTVLRNYWSKKQIESDAIDFFFDSEIQGAATGAGQSKCDPELFEDCWIYTLQSRITPPSHKISTANETDNAFASFSKMRMWPLSLGPYKSWVENHLDNSSVQEKIAKYHPEWANLPLDEQSSLVLFDLVQTTSKYFTEDLFGYPGFVQVLNEGVKLAEWFADRMQENLLGSTPSIQKRPKQILPEAFYELRDIAYAADFLLSGGWLAQWYHLNPAYFQPDEDFSYMGVNFSKKLLKVFNIQPIENTWYIGHFAFTNREGVQKIDPSELPCSLSRLTDPSMPFLTTPMIAEWVAKGTPQGDAKAYRDYLLSVGYTPKVSWPSPITDKDRRECNFDSQRVVYKEYPLSFETYANLRRSPWIAPLTLQSEKARQLLNISIHRELQIQQLLGWMHSSPELFSNPEARQAFQFLLFEPGVLADELKKDADTASRVVSKFNDHISQHKQQAAKIGNLDTFLYLQTLHHLFLEYAQHYLTLGSSHGSSFNKIIQEIRESLIAIALQNDSSNSQRRLAAREYIRTFSQQQQLEKEEVAPFLTAWFILTTSRAEEPLSENLAISQAEQQSLRFRHDLQNHLLSEEGPHLMNQVVKTLLPERSAANWLQCPPLELSNEETTASWSDNLGLFLEEVSEQAACGFPLMKEGGIDPLKLDILRGNLGSESSQTSWPKEFENNPFIQSSVGSVKDRNIQLTKEGWYVVLGSDGTTSRVKKIGGKIVLQKKYLGQWLENIPLIPNGQLPNQLTDLLNEGTLWRSTENQETAYIFKHQESTPCYELLLSESLEPKRGISFGSSSATVQVDYVYKLNREGSRTPYVLARNLDSHLTERALGPLARFIPSSKALVWIEQETGLIASVDFPILGLSFTREGRNFLSDQIRNHRLSMKTHLPALHGFPHFLRLEPITREMGQNDIVLLPMSSIEPKGHGLDPICKLTFDKQSKLRIARYELNIKNERLTPTSIEESLYLAYILLQRQAYSDARRYILWSDSGLRAFSNKEQRWMSLIIDPKVESTSLNEIDDYKENEKLSYDIDPRAESLRLLVFAILKRNTAYFNTSQYDISDVSLLEKRFKQDMHRLPKGWIPPLYLPYAMESSNSPVDTTAYQSHQLTKRTLPYFHTLFLKDTLGPCISWNPFLTSTELCSDSDSIFRITGLNFFEAYELARGEGIQVNEEESPIESLLQKTSNYFLSHESEDAYQKSRSDLLVKLIMIQNHFASEAENSPLHAAASFLEVVMNHPDAFITRAQLEELISSKDERKHIANLALRPEAYHAYKNRTQGWLLAFEDLYHSCYLREALNLPTKQLEFILDEDELCRFEQDQGKKSNYEECTALKEKQSVTNQLVSLDLLHLFNLEPAKTDLETLDDLSKVLTTPHESKGEISSYFQSLLDEISTGFSPLNWRFIGNKDDLAVIHTKLLKLEAETIEELATKRIHVKELLQSSGSQIDVSAKTVLEHMSSRSPELSIEALCSHFMQRNLSAYPTLNPNLTAEQCHTLDQAILEYLLVATHLQHIQRTVERIHLFTDTLVNPRATEEQKNTANSAFAKEFWAKRAYDVTIHPELLVFEYHMNLLLFPQQVEALQEFGHFSSEHTAGMLLELIMGSGKTKVLLPLLSQYLCDGDKLAIIVLPEELLASMSSELNQIMKKGLEISVENIPIQRHWPKETADLQLLLKRMNEIRTSRRVLIWSHSDIQSLFLNYLDTLDHRQLDDSKLELYREIFSLLTDHATVLVDELDGVFNVLKSHHYASGQPQALDNLLIDTVISLYTVIYTDHEIRNLAFTDAESPVSEGNFRQYVRPALISLIKAGRLLPSHSAWQEFLTESTEETLDAIESYLQGDSDYPISTTIKGAPTDVLAILSVLHEELNSVLPHTWEKVLRVHYGPLDTPESRATRPWSIPYHKGVPSHNSQFGTPLETLNYTIQTLLQEGIDPAMLMHKLKTLNMQQQENWVRHLEANLGLSTPGRDEVSFLEMEYSHDLLSPAGLARACEQINRSPSKILEIARDTILTKIPVYPDQISTNAFIYQTIFQNVHGMSGTLWNRHSYPRIFNQEEAFLSDTLTTTLGLLWGHSPHDVQVLEVDPEQALAQIIEYPDFKTGSVIDLAGTFRDLKNHDVAKKLLYHWQAAGHITRHVLYYGEDSQIWAASYDHDSPVLASSLSTKLDEISVFWDQRHTTGSDIRTHPKMEAVVTVGKHTLLRDLLQAVWRLRKLDRGQQVRFVVDNRDAYVIRDTLINTFGELFSNNDSLTLGDLIRYTSLFQAEQWGDHNFRSIVQHLNHQVIHEEFLHMMDPAVSLDSVVKAYERIKPLVKTTKSPIWFESLGQVQHQEDSRSVLYSKVANLVESFYLSKGLQENLIQEVDRSHAHVPAFVDSPASLVDSGRLDNELTIEIEMESEQEKETEQEQETQQFIVNIHENQLKDSYIINRHSWKNANLYTTHLYESESNIKVTKERIEGDIDYHIQTEKLTTRYDKFCANFPDIPKLPNFDIQLSVNLAPQFSQPDIHVDMDHLLLVHDKETGSWKGILLPLKDTWEIYNKPPQESIENVELVLIHLDHGIYWRSSSAEPSDKSLLGQHALHLITQAKLMSGRSHLTSSELEYLHTHFDSQALKQMKDYTNWLHKKSFDVKAASYQESKLEALLNAS